MTSVVISFDIINLSKSSFNDDDFDSCFKLEPVIGMSPENISVGVWKFEFNLGSNWKIQCYSI